MSENLKTNPQPVSLESDSKVNSLPKHESLAISYETTVDSLGIERQIFHLDPQTELVFRGKEELPDLSASFGKFGRPLLLTAETPVYTDQQQFQAWQAAAKTDKDNHQQPDCLVATASPLGLVEAALALTSRQLYPGPVASLDQLQAKLKTGHSDPQVNDLYDSIFAAVTIAQETDNQTLDPQSALVEVVLALAGDQQASQLLATKQAERASRDVQNYQQVYGGAPDRQPNPAELDHLRAQNLIAVHTTPTSPEHGRILPTAAYNQQTKDYVPRISIHASPNHPVSSHLYGNFDSQDYTVVSPLVGLVAANGLPDVLCDVDIFFSVDADQGLKLPKETVVIQTGVTDQQPVLEQQAQKLSLRAGPFTEADLAQLSQSDYYYQRAPPTAVVAEEIAQTLNSFAYIDLPESDLASYLDQPDDFVDINGQFILKTNLANLLELKQLATSLGLETDLKSVPADQQGRQLAQAYLKLETDQVSDCQYITKLFQEAIRKNLVRGAIKAFGGDNVEAGAHYTFNQAFQDKVHRTAKDFNLRTSLHTYTLEASFETSAYTSKRDSLDSLKQVQELDEPTDEIEAYQARLELHRQYTNWQDVWHNLDKLKPQWRRIAIKTDMLAYASPNKPTMPEALANRQPLI